MVLCAGGCGQDLYQMVGRDYRYIDGVGYCNEDAAKLEGVERCVVSYHFTQHPIYVETTHHVFEDEEPTLTVAYCPEHIKDRIVPNKAIECPTCKACFVPLAGWNGVCAECYQLLEEVGIDNPPKLG